MLHLLLDKRPWFRAKTHGYGTGLPIAWQGWVLLVMHIALIFGLVMLLRDQPVVLAITTLLAAFVPLPLYRARTEGGWRWNRGGRAGGQPTRKGRGK